MPVPTPDTPDVDDIYEGRFAELLPDMNESEFERLQISMEQHGFDETTPIVVTPDGEIVDGHHRYRAAQAVDVEPELVVADDVDVEQAIRTNLARRDHDNKRDIVVGWLLSDRYDGERSQREIAEELGVTPATVNRAMKEAFPERYEDDEDDTNVSPETSDGVDHSRESDTSTDKGSAESDSADEPDTDVSDSREDPTSAAERLADETGEPEGNFDGSEYDQPEPDELEREPVDGAASDGGVTPDTPTPAPAKTNGPDLDALEDAQAKLADALDTLDRVEGELPENPPTWFYDVRTYLERTQEHLRGVDGE